MSDNEMAESYEMDEQRHVKRCLKRWDEAVAKYPDTRIRNVMAQVIDQQWQVQETAKKMREATDQTTSTFGVSVFPNSVVYPLIDQVFPNLIAQQICLVKPMRTSVANIYTKTRRFSSGNGVMTHTGSPAATGEGAVVPKGRMVYTSDTVTAAAYKLQAVYSTETIEDALRDGNVNFENDMLRDLADEVIGEIDWLVLNAMFDAAGNSASFASSAVHSYETVREHNQELWDAIVDANNTVFADMQRNCNFIVGDATAIGRLEKLQEFTLIPGAADDVFNAAAVRAGTLNNTYAVFKSTNAPSGKLLLGIRDMGYMYCPYIPLELMPATYETNTDEWARSVRTRFGKHVLDANALCALSIS